MTRGHWRREEDFDEPDLNPYIRAAVSARIPFLLLWMVSRLMYASEPRRRTQFRSTGPSIEREDLVARFVADSSPEASAMLAVIAEFMANGDVLAASIRAELAARPPLRPRWLSRIGETKLQRAVRISDPLDEVDTVLLEVRIPTRGDFTCVVELDLDLLDLPLRIDLLDKPIDDVLSDASPSDFRQVDLDLADVGARLTEAVKFEYLVPGRESSPWPEYGALVEWLVGLLPEGGWRYPRPPFEQGDIVALNGRFFESAHGAAFSRRHHDEPLTNLVMFGIECHPGDPRRWSARRAEEFLFDHLGDGYWDPDELQAAPYLLRAFIRFVHDEVGIRRELTDGVLAAIDGWQLRYQERVRRLLADEDDCA